MVIALRHFVRFLAFAAGSTNLCADILVDPVQIELGSLKQQAVATAEVRLENTGDDPVALLSVRADCGCTVANLKTNLLEPGASTLLGVSVETRDYSGVLSRTVHIQTSSGEVVVPIRMTVVPYENWTLTPSALVMPVSIFGEEAKMQVALSFSGSGYASLRAIECTPAWIQAESHSAGENTFGLELIKMKDAPVGRHSIKVTVATSDPEEPQVTFNVMLPISGQTAVGTVAHENSRTEQTTLRVVPSTMAMPTVGLGEISKREFALQGWQPDKAPRFDIQNGSVREVRRQGSEIIFELAITPARAGRLSHRLRVFDDEELLLEVPVIIRVALRTDAVAGT